MTDAQLLLRVQRGDLTAWEPLFARCMPTVWRTACALVSDTATREDLVSEAFLAFVRGLPTLEANAVHLHGWLRGIVQHKAADLGRQRIRRQRFVSAGVHRAADATEHDATTQALEIEETRHQVQAILEQLPELQRLVLEWKHADDESVRDIANRLGQTEKAVESLLYRARKEFRRKYRLISGDDAPHDFNDAAPATLENSL